MRKLLLGSLIAVVVSSLLLVTPPVTHATSPEEPGIVGESAIVVDAGSGAILYQQDATRRLAPASLTKIFTSYFAIESTPLHRRMTVETGDLVGEASAGLTAGDNLSFETLLHGLLLVSGNDAAMTIARNVGENRSPAGLNGVESFLDAVNARLPELGLNDTHLQNPHGLDEDGHYSSARDVAAMTLLALRTEPDFLRVTSAPGYSGEDYQFPQRNQLIGNYPGALGGKTGITDNAGYCLMGIAHRDGRTIVGVVMGSTADDWYRDMMTLLDYGFATAVASGQPTIQFPTQATMSTAAQPLVQGLTVQATDVGAAVVRPAADTGSNVWHVLRWPIAALLAMIVAFVVAIQTRALIELQKRPMARRRRGARPRPAVPVAPRHARQIPARQNWEPAPTSWSVSVGD